VAQQYGNRRKESLGGFVPLKKLSFPLLLVRDSSRGRVKERRSLSEENTPPLFTKERGIKGVRLINNLIIGSQK